MKKGAKIMIHNTIQDKITNEFYWFHQHPEVSFKEVDTTARIRKDLQEAGIRILALPLQTGLVAEIGTGDHPIVALRCDIDALPVTEETGLPYQSVYPGRMHACGHDFHTAAILGAAYILKEQENHITGTIRIIFQPGEEGPSGAVQVVRTGIIDDLDVIFGMHCTPLLEVGNIGYIYGPAMAAVDAFQIDFTGTGTHGAHPNKGTDQIVAAAAFVGAVQTIVSRNMDPFAANLVSVTHIEGGHNWNVIPDKVFLEGTTRAMTAEERKLIRKRVDSIALHIGEAYGVQTTVRWIAGPPALCNDAVWGKFANEVAQKHDFVLAPMAPSLGGEDFAFYTEKVKSYFTFVGTGLSYPNHNAKFKVDPAALYPAALYMADLAVQAAAKLKGSTEHD
jgi:amidohydrolase